MLSCISVFAQKNEPSEMIFNVVDYNENMKYKMVIPRETFHISQTPALFIQGYDVLYPSVIIATYYTKNLQNPYKSMGEMKVDNTPNKATISPINLNKEGYYKIDMVFANRVQRSIKFQISSKKGISYEYHKPN
jgi:hypothetical protein